MDMEWGGEFITGGARGNRRKGRMPATPDAFALDVSRPLPDDWHVGRREVSVEGPVLRPEFWFDPFHGAVMSQIRSGSRWAQGFFRLYPESVVRVRYRADRPGPGQVVAVVRTGRVADPASGCLE